MSRSCTAAATAMPPTTPLSACECPIMGETVAEYRHSGEFGESVANTHIRHSERRKRWGFGLTNRMYTDAMAPAESH